ncbi:DUF234 domain-containing protein [Sulfurimonas sp. SWIR-19]|uniref:DUF234 domain-containing protein n=1 Tax=Sulfurimonas sp. SWIR-19 TaxID=2878390 RepID=UPI001CF206CE|nr:DUF234 domain-containing protein [Sulfurimonas sp. SWIR-19]UCN00240.1 DUF234 domain-containing protein [Sulfurimonas sp. SWIR-19]
MISNDTTLKEEFKIFYKEHPTKNFEDLVEKFAIFGGVGWGEIDTSKPSYELIEKLILKDYHYIRNDVSDITGGAPLYHALLSAVAMGDGKTHSSYKRAKLEKEVGDNAVSELVERGIIRVEKPKKEFTSWSNNEKIDNKLYFTTPFLRFWFAFVSPLFKGIRDGDYTEVKKRWQNREAEFSNLIFTQLSHELLKENFAKEDPLVEISSYWDKNAEFDIFAKTQSGKTILGSTKYTNAKVKKSELTRLQELAKKAGIDADIYVIVAKKGFSSELKALKGQNLRLLTLKNFAKLVE